MKALKIVGAVGRFAIFIVTHVATPITSRLLFGILCRSTRLFR